jgi:sporulation protein YlmC with PRC-barrel domain
MSRNNQNNQNFADSPLNTLLREEVMEINGQKVGIWEEANVKKDDGSWVRQKISKNKIAADGRWLRADEFVGNSWTGLEVPKDSIAPCLNPFEEHEYRLVYLNLDGVVTELKNVLCSECWERQKNRLFWRTVLLFGLIYNPKEY